LSRILFPAKGWNVGFDITLDYKFILEMFLLVSLGITLTVAGYLIRGLWGAFIAIGGGAVLFLYLKGCGSSV